MGDTEPGLFETWWRMCRERKAREAMTAQVPDEIAAEITADAAGLHDPEPVRGRSESLREFLQRTPHLYAPDGGLAFILPPCECGLSAHHEIHYGDDLLDTRAYVAARLEEIRAAWPIPEQEAAAEDIPREAIEAEASPPSDGVLGYLVAFARTDGGVTGVVEGVTHTTPMDLEGAQREAKAHGVSSVREWFAVEMRRVAGA